MGKAGERAVEVDGRELKLTNLDKVLYPRAGFTKGEVIDYYARIAPAIIPHLKGRALTLRRFPEGVDDLDAAFFEKRCPKHRPEWVKTATVLAGPHAGDIDFCVCEDLPTLIWMAQLAAIELHPSLSLAKRPEQPTVLAFDLDPGPPADVVDCCRIAIRLRELFAHFDLECHPKTSGSKGLQVYLPLNTRTDYDQTKPFARAMAQLLEKQTPDRVVSKMSKAERKGKVFVDWSQNHQRKTTIAVYSLRARERPTVSTPVGWDEVERAVERNDAASLVFEAGDVLERFSRRGDLFAPVLESKQRLPKFEKLAAA
ncbi:MAG TPA: non-homologous end-joining DNA ligase [Solirubrobacterales bacterium]|nr:non-homologous end-joining DNA ligase [Solirubrobacterales bacterium]